jgi:hypothetical protein
MPTVAIFHKYIAETNRHKYSSGAIALMCCGLSIYAACSKSSAIVPLLFTLLAGVCAAYMYLNHRVGERLNYELKNGPLSPH